MLVEFWDSDSACVREATAQNTVKQPFLDIHNIAIKSLRGPKQPEGTLTHQEASRQKERETS